VRGFPCCAPEGRQQDAAKVAAQARGVAAAAPRCDGGGAVPEVFQFDFEGGPLRRDLEVCPRA
jgi:hypothetical protein